MRTLGSRAFLWLLLTLALGISLILMLLLLGGGTGAGSGSGEIISIGTSESSSAFIGLASSSSSSRGVMVRNDISTRTSQLLPPLYLRSSVPRIEDKTITGVSKSEGEIPFNKKPRIAYAITVTKDGPFVDGAIVLGYSARKVHDPSLGYYPNTYEAVLVAFVTPGVISSRPLLMAHGWRIIEKTVPVSLEEIENKDYVDKVLLFLPL